MTLWKISGYLSFENHGDDETIYCLTEDDVILVDVDSAAHDATNGEGHWTIITEIKNLGSFTPSWVSGEKPSLDVFAASFNQAEVTNA